MLDSITPQQFDEWVAYLSIEPAAMIGHDWIYQARLFAELINVILATHGASVGLDAKKMEFLEIDDLLPREYRTATRKRPRRYMSDAEGFAMLRRMTGV